MPKFTDDMPNKPLLNGLDKLMIWDKTDPLNPKSISIDDFKDNIQGSLKFSVTVLEAFDINIPILTISPFEYKVDSDKFESVFIVGNYIHLRNQTTISNNGIYRIKYVGIDYYNIEKKINNESINEVIVQQGTLSGIWFSKYNGISLDFDFVQYLDSNTNGLVIDEDYTHTDNNYSDSEKSSVADSFHKSVPNEFNSLTEETTLTATHVIPVESPNTTPSIWGKLGLKISTLLSWIQTNLIGGSGGYESNLYLTTIDSGVVGYKSLSYNVEANETLVTIVANNSTVQGSKYLYPDSVGVATIPQGTWKINQYCKVSSIAGGVNTISVRVFRYLANGTEVDLFTISKVITNTNYDFISLEYSLPSGIACNATDRIGRQTSFTTTIHNNTQLISVIGNGHASYMVTSFPLRHSLLRDLSWTKSRHTGVTNKLAGFDSNGVAIEYEYRDDLISSEVAVKTFAKKLNLKLLSDEVILATIPIGKSARISMNTAYYFTSDFDGTLGGLSTVLFSYVDLNGAIQTSYAYNVGDKDGFVYISAQLGYSQGFGSGNITAKVISTSIGMNTHKIIIKGEIIY